MCNAGLHAKAFVECLTFRTKSMHASMATALPSVGKAAKTSRRTWLSHIGSATTTRKRIYKTQARSNCKREAAVSFCIRTSRMAAKESSHS